MVKPIQVWFIVIVFLTAYNGYRVPADDPPPPDLPWAEDMDYADPPYDDTGMYCWNLQLKYCNAETYNDCNVLCSSDLASFPPCCELVQLPGQPLKINCRTTGFGVRNYMETYELPVRLYKGGTNAWQYGQVSHPCYIEYECYNVPCTEISLGHWLCTDWGAATGNPVVGDLLHPEYELVGTECIDPSAPLDPP